MLEWKSLFIPIYFNFNKESWESMYIFKIFVSNFMLFFVFVSKQNKKKPIEYFVILKNFIFF